MDLKLVLLAIEEGFLATWVRESDWGFAIALSLHALGMAFAVGISFTIAIRILGIVREIPYITLLSWIALFRLAVLLALFSGMLLLVCYPAKALTNPVFYLKLSLIILGLLQLRYWRSRVLLHGSSASFSGLLGVGLLFCWTGSIAAGRLLAYTYAVLSALQLQDIPLAGDPFFTKSLLFLARGD